MHNCVTIESIIDIRRTLLCYFSFSRISEASRLWGLRGRCPGPSFPPTRCTIYAILFIRRSHFAFSFYLSKFLNFENVGLYLHPHSISRMHRIFFRIHRFFLILPWLTRLTAKLHFTRNHKHMNTRKFSYPKRHRVNALN